MQKGRKAGKRIAAVFLALFLLIVLFFGVGWLGALCADLSWTHWRPNYPKKSISPLLQKEELTEADYQLLYRQTGLTKIAVDDLRAADRTSRILEIQDAFFANTTVNKRCFAPFTYIEELDRNIPFARLEDGDIVISAATRVSFFRYGHAALVVDGEYFQILEALEPGSKSKINSAFTLANMANFIILRPKVDKTTRERVAFSAIRDYVGVPYSLTAGLFGAKYQDNLTNTQCAHLVWQAYMRYGIDLDSDGGGIVKPQDFLSEKVEVVQVYGFDLDLLWR